MFKEYYLLSLKWTNKKDKWFTFWRSDAKGYTWFKEYIGTYDEEKALKYNGFDDTLMIEKDIIDKLWDEFDYEGSKKLALLNIQNIRSILQIDTSDLKSKYKTTN